MGLVREWDFFGGVPWKWRIRSPTGRGVYEVYDAPTRRRLSFCAGGMWCWRYSCCTPPWRPFASIPLLLRRRTAIALVRHFGRCPRLISGSRCLFMRYEDGDICPIFFFGVKSDSIGDRRFGSPTDKGRAGAH